MAQYKPWTDKAYMTRMYVEKRMTIDQIAEDCKSLGYQVTPMTIYNNLVALKIPIRGGNRKLGTRSVGGDPAKKARKGFY